MNNVGVMLSHPMEFELASEKDIWSHVNVNTGSVPAMSKLVLPGMLSRGKGAVVNVASIAGFHPIPLMGIYAASKVTISVSIWNSPITLNNGSICIEQF